MDMDKLKHWMEFAQKFQGDKFWNDVFNDENAKKFMNENNFSMDQSDGKTSQQQSDFPKHDIYHDETHIYVFIELPGVDKHHIDLKISRDYLQVKGTVRAPLSHAAIIKSERFSGEFERTFPLPSPTDGKNVLAKFENGLLEVRYEKLIQRQESIDID